ncbi:MAG TPA: leucine-responsive transcriptional regulator Lrp [Azospirillaceae bacterium]|nr:leucine-responsive transcriptional regulator Lrp [Azospirillaceae bacterium]
MERRVDRIDLRILDELQRDGRLTNVELARRVGLSPTPCLERVRRLERDGYIRGYQAVLDPHLLDAGLLVFLEVSIDRTSPEAFQAFAAAVAEREEILECHMVAGGFDYLVKVRVRDMQAYREFLGRTLAELPGIRETRTYVVMEEVKAGGRLSVPAGD